MQRVVVVVLLAAYGAWLWHGDHDYRNSIVFLGGAAGSIGFAVAIVLCLLIWHAASEHALTVNTCTTNCDGGRYAGYEGIAFAYLANVFGWLVGAALGRLLRRRPEPHGAWAPARPGPGGTARH